MKNIFALSILASVLLSCNESKPGKNVEEGKLKGKYYTSDEIGWTVKVPEGWTVISTDVMEEQDKIGREALDEVVDGVDYSGLKHLINFKKNKFNIFQSTSEHFELEYEGEWEDNHEALKDVVYMAYTNQGIPLDTSSSKAIIDGIKFEVFHIQIISQEGEVILFQDMYGAHINGFDFGVNLNYNNEEDKAILLNTFKNSKFKKKKTS